MTTRPTVTSPGHSGPAAVLPNIGEPVGRYVVLAELGAGAMGVVFLASDAQLGRRIALKVLTHDARDNRLLDEARALARLQHPNVVAIHDVGWWESRVYMAMEYIEGTPLDAWLTAHPGWRERLAVFEQAAHGLAAAHRADIVHHDVKPSNIMVGSDGRVRLVDFGLARSASPDLALGSPGGTPRYMSPEQRRGDRADARSDQFALCMALYEALFGEYPFPGETPEERDAAVLAGRVRLPVKSAIPVRVRDAIVKGLALAPDERHASMEAFLAAVAPPRSHRMLWLGGAAIAAIAAGGVALAMPHGEKLVTAMAAPKQPGPYDAILAASHLLPPQPQAIAGDPYHMTVHRLANGLTVYISPTHVRPRVIAQLRFHGGYADAPGIAELAEGMAGKGTESIGTVDFAAEKPLLDQIAALYARRAKAPDDAARAAIDAELDPLYVAAAKLELPNEHSRVLKELGATDNDNTIGPDETRFSIELPSNRLATWADLEADRWTHPVFRLFRMQVSESLAGFRDSAHSMGVRDAVDGALYHGHPYGVPTAEAIRVIEREPYAEVERFFREHYVPNNAELVLVGDIDPETALPILERAFAGWKPRALPPRNVPVPAPLAATQAVTVATSGEQAVSYFWTIPPIDGPEFAAMELLAPAVKLIARRDGGPAVHVDASIKSREQSATYGVRVSPPVGGTLDDAEHLLARALEEIRGGTLTDEMLEGLKRAHRVGWLLATYDDLDRIERITKPPMGRHTWRDRLARDAAYERVTRAELVRAAADLLARPHLVVRQDVGKVEMPAIHAPKLPDAHFADGRSRLARELAERAVVPIQPKVVLAGRDYQERATPGGHLVAVREADRELFGLQMYFDVGRAELPLSCTLIDARTNDHDIQDIVLRYGFTFSTHCSVRNLEVDIEGLDEDLPHAPEVLAKLLAPPSDDAWRSAIGSTRRWIADRASDPDYVENAMTTLALFGPGHPLFHATDDAAIRGATPERARQELATLRRTDRWYGYHGRRGADEVAALLPAREAGVGAVPLALHTKPAPRTPVLLLDAPDLDDDVHVSIAFGLGVVPHEDAPELELFEEYWSPSLQPLAQRLRGIADPRFTIALPDNARDDGFGVFTFGAAAPRAGALIGDLLDEALAKTPDPAILKRAKAAWDERDNSDWYCNCQVPLEVARWHLTGYAGDPAPQSIAKLANVDTTMIARVADRLKRAPRAIVIWGNLDGLDRAAVAKLGDVRKVTIPELVGGRSR